MPQEFLVTAPRTIEFRDYEDLPLEETQVRVRTQISGIKSGTEMAIYRGTAPTITQRLDPELRLFVPRESPAYPVRLGCWGVGEVVEVGSGVTRFQVGDRVHAGMGHRPTNRTSAANLYLLGEMAPETALFTDPLLFALQTIHDAAVKAGDAVAIFGMGLIGLLAVQVARASGADRVLAVDLIPQRLDLAHRFGADTLIDPSLEEDVALAIKRATGNKGVDVAIEISGSPAALNEAVRCVRQSGLVVAAAYYQGGAEALRLGAEWHHNRVTMRSSMAVWDNPHRSHPLWNKKRVEETAVAWLATGRIRTEGLISHRFPYHRAAEAYQLIDQRLSDTLKLVLEY
jgi:2-desacetyl-2-hydroxyethyl bacteriochlorophyllide A dehydrogenase